MHIFQESRHSYRKMGSGHAEVFFLPIMGLCGRERWKWDPCGELTGGCRCCSIMVMSDSVTPWAAACQASLSFTISWSLLRLMSNKPVMPSNNLILCHPLLLLLSIFSSIRVFSNELALHIRWPKYWSFSFNISPSSKYSGLISFRLNDLISLVSKGLSRVFSSTIVQKHQKEDFYTNEQG